MDVMVAPILMTITLLIVYYLQFFLAMLLGCARLCRKETGQARKISFAVGQVIHFMFIICILFGVFSRHFANGGAQLLAYTAVNIYVYLLCFLNYPVIIYVKEYDVSDD